MLKRKDLKFRLANRHKEFAVIQFAQFMKPTDVVTAVMEQFKTELAADIEKYGAGEIRRYLSHNFWTLNPKNGKMPEKFTELFETHKQLYLNTYNDSYLRHPRNVVKELDTLYEKCTQQLENAEPDKARQLMPTMLKIIQTVRNTIDAIPLDELEKEDGLFQTIKILTHFGGEIEKPDPLAEEDEQKLRELLKTESPFEEIRKFVEYLRCKDQDVFLVQPSNRDPKEGPDVIRGRPITITFLP
ncbi:MAG: hypothetical protein OXH00_23965 [Candidatus Poribacteria bacterium]|nr:hypothetical protein [Candidatus Poribacteria bacterium]